MNRTWTFGKKITAGFALAFVLMWRWFAVRLQGFTGDCLGATQQICEIAFYLGLTLGLGAAL